MVYGHDTIMAMVRRRCEWGRIISHSTRMTGHDAVGRTGGEADRSEWIAKRLDPVPNWASGWTDARGRVTRHAAVDLLAVRLAHGCMTPRDCWTSVASPDDRCADACAAQSQSRND